MTDKHPLRILMIHNRYRAPGGEDTSTDTQVALLRAAGHDVVLLEDSNERVSELGNLRTAVRSIWSPEAHRRVENVLTKRPFDLMHVQNLFPLFSPSIYYAARRCGVPVIQSLRNFRALCPEGMLFRDGHECTDCVGKPIAWPAVAHRCYRGSAMGAAVVATMGGGHRAIGTWKKRVARYVTPSLYARDVYIDGGWDPASIEVIPNFVYPDPGPGSGDGGYVLFAGRLAPPKGLDTLLAAWSEPGIRIPLKIAGEGPLKWEVRDTMKKNPLIEYLGPVATEAVSDLIGDAMFVVVPTRGIETFGRAAAEALAKGTPAVVSDHGGLREIVTDGVSGLLFPPGDTKALVGAIRRLLDDPEMLAKMRGGAREEYERRFSGDELLGIWEDLYRSVAAAS